MSTRLTTLALGMICLLLVTSCVDTPHGSRRGMLRLRTAHRLTAHQLTVAPDGPVRPECTDAWSEEQALTQAVPMYDSRRVQGGVLPLPEGERPARRGGEVR
jgi:hypothetical protein